GDPEISCGDPEIIFGDLYDFDIDKKNGLFGLYFERMMQKKIARIVSENPASHRINQVWSVEITSTKTADTKQEFDVLLVTDFGTLISLDAKTFEFRKKDEDARTLNLYRASGFYTDFYSVFPFLHADLSNKESQLNSNAEWKKMKNRPYEIKRRDGKMLAFCEDEAPDLVLTNEKERPTDFELKKLSDMLACLNLLC
ncbi:MAG: hypothetical protein Q4G66_10745, partial [bacterium]|nr:hypothetical protein [bacterium]